MYLNIITMFHYFQHIDLKSAEIVGYASILYLFCKETLKFKS